MKKNKIVSLLEYIIAICIVINCNTVWDRIGFQTINDIILVITALTLNFIIIKTLIINKKNFLELILFSLFIIIYNLTFIYINGENTKLFILNFIVILICLMIYSVYSIKEDRYNQILIKIANVVFVLSIISIVFYIFANCLNIIQPTDYVLLRWGSDRRIPGYFGVYYNTQWINLNGVHLIRNTGIFTEAPMYSFILCISLLIELFIIRRIRKKNVFVLLLTIFSTLSTTGITISLTVLTLQLILKKSKTILERILKITIIPVIIILALSLSLFFVKDKINESGNKKYGSFETRTDDFKIGLEAWKENKIIGHGYERHDITQQYMGSIRVMQNDIGGSSGLMMVLPQGGIYLTSIYIIPLIMAMLYGIINKKLNVIIISLVVFILFIFTNIPYRYLMIYFLAIGLSLGISSLQVKNEDVVK